MSISDLTDAKARNIAPDDAPIAAGGVPGLFLFPGRTKGRGKWILRFVSPETGKRRDMGLGVYPDLGVAAARKTALGARERIAAGQDPIAQRRASELERRLSQDTPDFQMAACRVHDEIKAGFRNTKHADQWINTLQAHVFPKIGRRPVTELKASDFADVLRPIWLSKPETASRVRQRCDTVMKWCAAHDYIVASPVGVVTKLLAKQPGKRERVEHHPAVPWRKMPDFVQAVLRRGRATEGKQMLELLILTATRSGEIRGMRWDEINFDDAIWTIPAKRMKAKVLHRVPLPGRAVEILASRATYRSDNPLVFHSRNGTPLSDMVLTKLLRDAKVQSGTPGRTATAHGFRSAFRDWASENGYSRDLAERSLAHTISSSTEAAYHRTDLLEARRPMMEDWANYLATGA